MLSLVTKWNKKDLDLTFPAETTIGTLKAQLENQTGIPRACQKLVGLKRKTGGPLTDATSLAECSFRKQGKQQPHRFILMGGQAPTPGAATTVVLNDLDKSYTVASEAGQCDVHNHMSLAEKTVESDIRFIHDPRESKKLLVLDLDHCLLDFTHSSTSVSLAADLKRPFLDYFLAQTYVHFDLAIWSQTSWRWLEIKLTELGLLTHPAYRLCFVLDKTSMFKFRSTDVALLDRVKKSKKSKSKSKSSGLSVKPLELIWSHPVTRGRWHAGNTLHIDDLSRNFLMNPRNGIQIPAYYRHDADAEKDIRLFQLTHYLLNHCAMLPNVKSIDHSDWMSHTGSLREERSMTTSTQDEIMEHEEEEEKKGGV